MRRINLVPASIGRSARVRLAVLPFTVFAGLLTIRVIVAHEGESGFAIYALIAGVAALVTYADLGVGAAVTDAYTKRGRLPEEEINVIVLTSVRVLAASATLLLCADILLGLLGWWGPLLGLNPIGGINLAVTLAVATYVGALIPSMAFRVLIGIQQNHRVVLLQGLVPAVTLTLVLTLVWCNAPPLLLPAVPGTAAIVIAVTAVSQCAKTSALRPRVLAQRVMRRKFPGVRVRHMAVPMLIIQLALPVAFQTDRIVLSWASSIPEVAKYSLVAPLYLGLFSIVSATGGALWGHFGANRTKQAPARADMLKLVGVYLAAGGILASILLLLGPLVVHFESPTGGDVSWTVFAAFGMLLMTHSSWLPLGMYFTDARGLRFQAISCAVMATVNLSVGLVLASVVGAAGPVVASAVAIAAAQIAPGWWRFVKLDEAQQRAT